jgi:hypothetical protein
LAAERGTRRRRQAFRGMAVLGLLATLPGMARAQRTAAADTIPADTLVADTAAAGISPRGAMLRSFLVPGWGQSAVGSYRRAAIFFSLRAGAGYMLFKTIGRLNEAKQIEARGVRLARDSLDLLIAEDSAAAERLSNPLAYQTAVDSFPGLAGARRLVQARQQQRQDWITTFIVTTLLDGIDAYVNAQFEHFPVGIDSQPEPGGGVSLRLTVPLPWGPAPSGRDPRREATAFRPRSPRR